MLLNCFKLLRRSIFIKKELLLSFIGLLFLNTAYAAGVNIVKDPWSLATLQQQFETLKEQYQKMKEQLDQLKKQAEYLLEQLKTLKSQLEVMLLQVQKLTHSKYEWRTIQESIKNLGDIIKQTKGIAYSAKDINQTFKNIFPGYREQEDYSEEYEEIINTTQNTLNGVLQSINQNTADFATSTSRMNDLKAASESAVGETSAIQATNQIVLELLVQIQLLRQIIAAQTNAQAIYYATEIQKEASANVELDKTITNGNKNVTGVVDNHPLEQHRF